MQPSLRERTREILARCGVRPRKKLSQHFLVDDHIFQRLIDACQLNTGDRVFEIGAGLGLLTEALCERAGSVTAVEVDDVFCRELAKRFGDSPNVKVVCENVLRANLPELSGGGKFKVVGNLPYHISGAILRWFLNHREYFTDFYCMLQKEVAQRIVANPGSKAYGALSLLCQYFATPELLFPIPATAFLPPPNVESAFLRLTPKPSDWVPSPLFVRVVKQAFSQRRKMLANNLKSWKLDDSSDWQKIFNEIGISGRERAEALNLETFVNLSEALTQKGVRLAQPEL